MSKSSSQLSLQEKAEPFGIEVEQDFHVFLSHYPSARSKTIGPLLFLHGASAWSNTFLIRPENPASATGRRQSIVEFFQDQGYDVWLLDWRGGGRPEIVAQVARVARERFTMDHVAELDIPEALKYVSGKAGGKKVDVIAHCMGAGSLAYGLGNAKFRAPIRQHLGKVVLSGLGLFYEAPWDGVTKVQDHLLDFIMGTDRRCFSINPDATEAPWPDVLDLAFKKWPHTWQPACKDEFCHRLAFMFGSPYLESNLSRGIHDRLPEFFGPIPIGLYAHAAQNSLRGYAAPFNVEVGTKSSWEECLDLTGFQDLQIGLVTGGQNILWHRESMDRMYDWLRRKLRAGQCQKRTIEGYGHQDLFWGKDAANVVFPALVELLKSESSGMDDTDTVAARARA